MSVAPNWTDTIEVSYKLYKVTPDATNKNTIARSTGTHTTRITWFEWCTPATVQALMEADQANGYLTELHDPQKPQEELDMLNGSLMSRKRAV